MKNKYMNSLIALLHAGQAVDGCLLIGIDYKNLPTSTVCPGHDCYNCIFTTHEQSKQVIKILENFNGK